jgi:hypothetical protein
MEIKTPFFTMRSGRRQVQEMEAQITKLVKIQELLINDNILTVQQMETNYSGNRYKTYDAAVLELARKYAGLSDWGVLQAGNIIDLRAAYIVGQGIKVSKVEAEGEDANPEYDFAQRFIEVNSLDHELPQDLAREAEIEGKTLIKLFPRVDPEDNETDILLRWVSWTSNGYTVKVDAEDYMVLDSVSWDPTGGSPVMLTPDKCVFKRFGGRLDIPNETMPRTAKCLTQIENLDMALRDWREINRLYAAPTPHVQCETPQQAKTMNEDIEKINWKVGKFLAHTGVFGYAQPSSEGQKAIESEIITLMKLISGTTGVPINFLGAPELTTKMGSDSQALLDLISMSTSKEREIWRGAYQELLEKAMLMWNFETKKTALRPDMIKVDLPVVTAAQWDRIVSTWLPLKNAGEITRKTLLGQIPGIDAEKEIEALDEESATTLDKFSTQNPPVDPNADPNAVDPNAPVDQQGGGQMNKGKMGGLTGQVLKYKSNPGNFAKKGA